MKVTNWDKWQTFRKDRGTPPWVKLYRNLLSNEQWVELSDAEKGQLVSIWILAADKDGVIPDSPKMIQRMAMLDELPNLNKFIELGFLSTTCQPHDNQEVNPCPQLDAPEKRRDREETEKNADFYKHINLLLLPKEISLNDQKSFIDYKTKHSIKKKSPPPTDRAILLSLNQAVKINTELGITYDEIFGTVEEKGWSGIKLEYFTKKDNFNGSFNQQTENKPGRAFPS